VGNDYKLLCHNALPSAAVYFYSITQGDGASAFALGCYAAAFQAAKKAL